MAEKSGGPEREDLHTEDVAVQGTLPAAETAGQGHSDAERETRADLTMLRDKIREQQTKIRAENHAAANFNEMVPEINDFNSLIVRAADSLKDYNALPGRLERGEITVAAMRDQMELISHNLAVDLSEIVELRETMEQKRKAA